MPTEEILFFPPQPLLPLVVSTDGAAHLPGCMPASRIKSREPVQCSFSLTSWPDRGMCVTCCIR